MSWLTEHPALAWLGLALVLGAVEAATVDFIFVMLAGGALAAALAAAAGAPFVLQVVAAVGVALLLIGVVRPVVVRKVLVGDPTLTGTAALVGRDARVVETVTAVGGRVRLGGEIWSARTLDQTAAATVLPGHSVRVLAIDGATAVVAAVPEPEIS